MGPKYLRIAKRIISAIMAFLLGFLVGRYLKEMHQGYPSILVILLIVFSCACIKLLIVNISWWSLDNKEVLKSWWSLGNKEVLNMGPKYLRIAERIISAIMASLLGFLVGRP